MNRNISLIMPVLVLAGCNEASKTSEIMDDQNQTATSPETNNTTPRVTGIGGIFFFDKPAETKEWYGKNLGLEIDDYGSVFESRNANRPEEIN